MASPSVQNPPAAAASKAAKKKKGKAERTESPAPASATPEKAASAAGDNQDDVSDAPHIRELKKNVRNVSKKISNLVKIEEKVAEHPDQSLDELVSQKIINGDQKASIQKKPALQSQLAQLEEQLAQAKKVEQEHRARLADYEKTLVDKFEKEKAELVAETKDKASAEASASLKDNLLILSQFLRLAAARRAEDADSHSDESQALEGVLLNVYSGDDNAVATMLKLVQGVDEPTPSTAGELLKTTFAEVKHASIAHAASFLPEVSTSETEGAESNEPQTDPTVANAGLTEIDDGSAVALTNGHTVEAPASDSIPSNADVADNAANAAGESQWDTSADQVNDLAISQEWVDVKREPSETETAVAANPAAPTNSQSWADDHPEPHEVAAAPADPNDGFHQVQRNRGNREGGFRGGRGDRGGYRGRGGRGDGRGRGRGRGGDRGGRGGMPSRPRPAANEA